MVQGAAGCCRVLPLPGLQAPLPPAAVVWCVRCVPHPVPGSNVGHPARPTPECTPPGTIARLLHPAPVQAFDNAAMQHPPELPMAPRPPKAFDRTSLGIPL